MSNIKFGTDGWRGIIAEDFTFENLKKVSYATALYFKNHKKIKNGIVVGYDARFLSKEFAETVAVTIASTGVKVLLSDHIATTPMVSLGIVKLNCAGGIVITASHNPAKYNGFKIKGDYGGPAHPEMIEKLEKILEPIQKLKSLPVKFESLSDLTKKRKIEYVNYTAIYLADLQSKIEFDVIKKENLKITFDAMYGAGQGIAQLFYPRLITLRNSFNPSFGGGHPEPLAQNLQELMLETKLNGADFGFATDGDADRVGAVDENGNFVDSHRIFAILLKYLVEHRMYKGEVVKSLSVSELITKICAKYKINLNETPVGFKYLCRLMTEKKVIIAGEESGGIGVMNHLPERDGIFIGFLLAEVISVRRKKLSELVKELFDEFGEHHYNRIDKHLTQKEKENIIKKCKSNPKKIGKFQIIKTDTTDGFKFFTLDGWILIRASGTEPLIRFYAEANTPQKVSDMLKAAMSL